MALLGYVPLPGSVHRLRYSQERNRYFFPEKLFWETARPEIAENKITEERIFFIII